MRFAVGFCLLAAVLTGAARAQTVQIGEFMAANTATVQDEDGDYSDWIELYNATGSLINLAGWSLTDDQANPSKWTFPAVAIDPGARLVVFASDKNRIDPDGQLHTNFKLGAGGEYLGLAQPDGSSIADEFSPAFPAQRDDVSYGRSGAQTGYFATPTPGAPNAAAYAGIVDDPVFGVAHGFFNAGFPLELTCGTDGAEIRYTLDGSVPATTHGLVYGGPLNVSQSTVVRAAAFKSDWLPTAVHTRTYLFPASVFGQPPAPTGLPATWGGFPASNDLMNGDYEMDPQVIGNPVYADRLTSALLSIPSISLAMPIEDWFDKTRGIYSNGALEGPEWERAVSAELILPDGGEGFAVRCGVQIQGGSSTEPNWKSPKLSMRLLFKDEFGPTELEYPFFPDGPLSAYNTLVLDARLNMTWIVGDNQSQRIHATYLRDAYANDLQLAMGRLSPHSRYVHLFLNGAYWGLYCVHERPDDHFMASYRGGDPDNYDVIRHPSGDDTATAERLVSGSIEDFNAMFDLAAMDMVGPENYEALIDQYLDIDPFLDYMLMNFWIGNTDWGDKNNYCGRDRTGGSKFQYYSWDAELSMLNLNTNGPALFLRSSEEDRPAPTALASFMHDNAEFNLRFGDHAYKHCYHDGVLTGENALELFERRVKEIDTAIILESARWGDHRRDHHPTKPVSEYDLYTRDQHWLAEIEWFRNAYFPNRTPIVIGQLRSRGVYPANDPPEYNVNGTPQHGGTVGDGDLLSLTNPNPDGTVYYTLNGGDPREPGATVYGGTIALSSPSTRVRSRIQAPDATWSALNEAVFTLQGTPPPSLRVVGLMYHPPNEPMGHPDAESIELMNVGTTAIELEGIHFTNGVVHAFPPWTLAPGETVLTVLNRAIFEAQYGPRDNIIGEFTSGRLDNGGEEIALADALDQTIQNFTYDDGWYPETDGAGPLLEIVDPANPDLNLWNVKEGWRAAEPDIVRSAAQDWLQYLESDDR